MITASATRKGQGSRAGDDDSLRQCRGGHLHLEDEVRPPGPDCPEPHSEAEVTERYEVGGGHRGTD